ncbi:MAG: hypothetical protein U5L74_09485 [Ideonella sp.]|nr:hypothetical protein [Ideonella sp.]
MEFEGAEHVLTERVRWLRLLIEAAGVLGFLALVADGLGQTHAHSSQIAH